MKRGQSGSYFNSGLFSQEMVMLLLVQLVILSVQIGACIPTRRVIETEIVQMPPRARTSLTNIDSKSTATISGRRMNDLIGDERVNHKIKERTIQTSPKFSAVAQHVIQGVGGEAQKNLITEKSHADGRSFSRNHGSLVKEDRPTEQEEPPAARTSSVPEPMVNQLGMISWR